MKTICLYFHIHQPFRLRNFPFFEIGNGMDYFDEELNRAILRKEAFNTYLPMNRLLLKLIVENKGRFNVSFCISGTALDQFGKYMPELIDSFRELSATGCVEFIGETYSHSLAGLTSREEFARQAEAHSAKINELFGSKPKVFQIPEMSYTDALGEILVDLGFKSVILEETEKSRENGFSYGIYRNAVIPDLKVVMNSQRMGNEIVCGIPDLDREDFPDSVLPNFDWKGKASEDVQLVNIRLNYWLFKSQKLDGWVNIQYLNKLIKKSLSESIQFKTPSYLDQLKPDALAITPPVFFPSGRNNSREIMKKLGNEMQQEAFYTLYELEHLIMSCPDPSIKRDWLYLQSSDHFYYMCTEQISPASQSPDLSPYESSFFAFINFMNVLKDIRKRAETILEELPISRQDAPIGKKKIAMEVAGI